MNEIFHASELVVICEVLSNITFTSLSSPKMSSLCQQKWNYTWRKSSRFRIEMHMKRCEELLEVIVGIEGEIISYDLNQSSQICSFRSILAVFLIRIHLCLFSFEILPDFLGSALILIHFVTCSIRKTTIPNAIIIATILYGKTMKASKGHASDSRTRVNIPVWIRITTWK